MDSALAKLVLPLSTWPIIPTFTLSTLPVIFKEETSEESSLISLLSLYFKKRFIHCNFFSRYFSYVFEKCHKIRNEYQL